MSQQLPLPMACQRWRRRHDSYRPSGERIDPGLYGVEPVDEAQARRFVVTHHYSGTYPAARFRAGLYRRATPRTGVQLVGVAVFSVPMQQRVIPRWTGVEPAAGVELGRFVLLDEEPGNAESWFLARAFRLLSDAKPEIRAVLSYSDPVPREDAEGRVVMPGHLGIIYRAHNGRFVGRSAPRKLALGPDGRALSMRALSKLRNAERGEAYAERQLVEMGAPRRMRGESGEAYVRRVMASGAFRPMRHPGNLAYVWGLDRETRRGLPGGLPYPTAREARSASPAQGWAA